MNYPDPNNPSKDCIMTVDSEGTTLKEGDVIQAFTQGIRDTEKSITIYPPVVKRADGNLYIPWAGSWLLEFFTRKYCTIIKNVSNLEDYDTYFDGTVQRSCKTGRHV